MGKQVAGDWALVTGASSGIGEEFARQLAAMGARLVLVARSGDKLEQLRDELVAAGSPEVCVKCVDLVATGAVERLVQELARDQIEVAHLINNAGVGAVGRLGESDPARLESVLKLNCVALTELSQRLLPDMVSRGRGGVLLVASVVGFLPLPGMAVYAASKSYVLALGAALAQELRGSGVTVTTLCPGYVETGFQSAAGFASGAGRMPGSLSAQQTARRGLRGYLRGHARVVPGFLNQLAVLGATLVPDRLLTVVAERSLSGSGRF